MTLTSTPSNHQTPPFHPSSLSNSDPLPSAHSTTLPTPLPFAHCVHFTLQQPHIIWLWSKKSSWRSSYHLWIHWCGLMTFRWWLSINGNHPMKMWLFKLFKTQHKKPLNKNCWRVSSFFVTLMQNNSMKAHQETLSFKLHTFSLAWLFFPSHFQTIHCKGL